MKIGIDARMYRSEVAGISRYSQNLIHNLLEIDHNDEFVLFMTSEDKKEFENFVIENLLEIDNCKLKIVSCNIKHYSVEEQTKLGKIITKENLDLMHFVNFNYPVNYKGKFIVTIHDLTLLFFPETAKQTNYVKKLAFRYVMQNAVKNAQKVIAVSENTKNDIIKKLRVESEKIKVIYEAADDKIFGDVKTKKINDIKKQYSIGDVPVILYVGQFRPHKNLVALVEAFNIIRKDIKCKLVILGKPDPKHTSFIESVDKSDKKEDIVMPGFVSNNEVTAWYKIAKVFCFPSLYEGFGLPGLEAMQAETAVVASNCSSLPEIYGNAALYFDPFNSVDIADKIKRVIMENKLRSALISKGKIRANKYSWKKTALDTLKVYREIIN